MQVFSLGSPHGVRPCGELAKNTKGVLSQENYPPRTEDSGPVAVWGQLRGAAEILRNRKEFYRLDHAYIGRNHYWRMTKNDFQPSKVIERPGDRWAALAKRFDLKIEPWQENGDHVVLALSMPGTYDFFGVTGWAKETQRQLEKVHKKVLVRQRKETRPIREDLKGASALYTFASNSVMEALMMGVPVFVAGPSIARPVSGEWSGKPVYPDRERFFNHVAYCQFTLEEYRSGFALQRANENEIE